MKLTLISRKQEVPGVESFVFKPEKPLVWKAGQFIHYVLHHDPTDDRGSDRWFTIASAPSEENPMITTRFTAEKGSTFKKALAAMKIGDEIEAGSDPDGDFILDDKAEEHVFIAGGIGVTPYRAIFKDLDTRGLKPSITLIYANRDENIVYKDEFEFFAKNNPNLKIVYVISPDRVDISKIRSIIPDLTKPVIYVSGPEPMVESLGNALKAEGIPPERLRQDWFPGYPAE